MQLNFYINTLLNFIVNNYFQDSRCLFVFSKDSAYTGDIPKVQLTITNPSDFKPAFNYFGCQGIVIISENPAELFTGFEKAIRLNMERFNTRKYLILSTNDDKDQDFFTLNELNYVADLLFITFHIANTNNSGQNQCENANKLDIQEEDIEFVLRTHRFVGEEDPKQAIFVNKWFSGNETFLTDDSLYPDKITNQEGKPLRMATFNYEPYSIIGDKVGNHYGSELTSAVQYGLKHNMTPVPVVNENDYWGEIFSNWSGNGLLGNLVEDNADVGFSALYTWEICYHFLDLSKPLVRTGITCLVPAPKLSAGWLTPLYSFAPIMWLYVVIIILVSILALTFIFLFYNKMSAMANLRYTRKKSNLFNILGISIMIVSKPILLQSLTFREMPREFIAKFVLFWVLLLGLVLTSTYSSGLATVMTIPRFDSAIDTVQQFADSNLDWGATQDAWITSIQTAEESVYVKIVSKFHPISEESLEEHSKAETPWAFSIERLPFENYAIGTYIKKDAITKFHVMQQDLYWEQCVIMLRKSSVLLPSLDLFILRVFEAGLVSKWQNTAVDLFMDSQVQRVVKYYKHHISERRGNVTKLKWIHVEGAFAALLLGYCLSLVVITGEVIGFRRMKKAV